MTKAKSAAEIAAENVPDLESATLPYGEIVEQQAAATSIAGDVLSWLLNDERAFARFYAWLTDQFNSPANSGGHLLPETELARTNVEFAHTILRIQKAAFRAAGIHSASCDHDHHADD